MAKLTRRNFLAGSALAAAAAGLAACNGGGAPAPADGGDAAPADDKFAAPAADAYPIDPDAEGTEALWTSEQTRDGWTKVTNPEGGVELGVMDASKIIQVNGLAFKDLNGNGKLDLYEDWRQDGDARPRGGGRSAFVFARLEGAPRRGEKRNPGKKPSHGHSAKEKDPQDARREAEPLRCGVPGAAPRGRFRAFRVFRGLIHGFEVGGFTLQ